MGQKLYRGNRSVFRKRNPALRVVLSILGAVAAVALGFFGAKFITENPLNNPAVSDQVQTTTQTKPTTTTTTAATDTTPDLTQNLRGFYLPHSALSADTLTEVSLLAEAKAAGYNAVIFDLKDVEGRLYYRFSDPTAQKVNSYTDNALTKEQLTALFDLFQENDLIPVPRLHAFRDNLGAKALPEARITPKSDASQSWFDGKPQLSTSKRWLSPYDNDAHDYIGGLASELKAMGAGAVMLDSVQFPNPSLTGKANFGTDNATLKADEVLTLFLSKMKTQLGEDCPVILSCTGESVLDNATQVYYNNPLTFAPTIASPCINPNTLNKSMEESMSQLTTRIKVIAEDQRPGLAPILEIESLSTAQVKQAMADCNTGGVTSFILYHPDGQYDFGAY